MYALSFGELLVDFVSPAGVASLEETPNFTKAPGGAPANVAVGLHRLGTPAGFVGQVGDDPFGHWLRDMVAREGVDVQGLTLSPAARTTLAFVATRLDGKKDICFYRNPGADAELTEAQLLPDQLRKANLFHCCSVSLSMEPCRSTQFAAVRRAKAAGALISFDPNWRPSLWDDLDLARDLIWQMMPLCDIVKVADEEWEFVTGTPSINDGAKKILEQGPRLVVVTRGAQGAEYAFEGGTGTIGGFPADAIDTLGAGDAFVAGLLHQIFAAGGLGNVLNTEAMNEILRFANACGAIATQKAGAIPALPNHAQVQEFLDKHPA